MSPLCGVVRSGLIFLAVKVVREKHIEPEFHYGQKTFRKYLSKSIHVKEHPANGPTGDHRFKAQICPNTVSDARTVGLLVFTISLTSPGKRDSQ